MDNKDLLEATLNALDRLLKMFMVERYVYLALTALSFGLLLYSVEGQVFSFAPCIAGG